MTNIELKKLIIEQGKKEDPNWEETVYRKSPTLKGLINETLGVEIQEKEISIEEIVYYLVDLANSSYLRKEMCTQYRYELMLANREDIQENVIKVLSKSPLIKNLNERLKKLRGEEKV